MRKLKLFSREQVGNASDTGRQYSRPDSLSLVSRQSVLAFLLVLLTTIFGVGNAQGEEQTGTFTMKNSGQTSPVSSNGVTFTWSSSQIITGTNNGSGFKDKKLSGDADMVVTIPAGATLTGISKTNGNSWGGSANVKVYTGSSTSGTLIATIVSETNSYTISSDNTGTTYYLINNTGANAWINSLSITYTTGGSSNPTISVDPESATYGVNDVATPLSVTATASAGDLHYQWYSNTTKSTEGASIVGTDAASYTPSTTSAGTTYYYCVVTDGNGSATSGFAAVKVSEPTGTFELFSGDLVEGDYVLVYATRNNAMKASQEANDKRMDYAVVTPSENKIANPDASLVWHIAPISETSYWTIYSAEAEKYVGSTNSDNQAKLLSGDLTDNMKWTVTSSDGKFDFSNVARVAARGNPYLRNNDDGKNHYGFACYAKGTGGPLTLYKKQVAGQPKAPTFSVEGGNYESAQSVELSCETEGATIYYTTNGDAPTSSSTQYNGTAIAVDHTMTIKAIAIKDEISSTVASATYTIIVWQTVADVWDDITADGPTNAHIYGYVSQINVGGYANNFYISDNGSTEGNQLYAYRMNMNSFSVAVGDKVKLAGDLMDYQGTKQFKYANSGATQGLVVALEAKGALQSVAVSGSPTKTEYASGEEFNPAGLKVFGTYANGFVGEITEGEIAWGNDLTGGKVTENTTVHVTATVNEVASPAYEVAVTVAAKTLVSIAAIPESYTIYKGQALPKPTIIATYSDGESVDVSAEAFYDTKSEFDKTTADTYTITVSYTFGEPKTATYEVTVKEYANDAENPYTVAEATQLIESVFADESTDDIYVHGIVSKIVEAYQAKYGNVTYNISDDGKTSGAQIKVFRCTASSADDIKEGDEVIVKGHAIYYQSSTPELLNTPTVVYLARTPNFEIEAVTGFEVGTADLAVADLTITKDGEGAVTLKSSDKEEFVTIEGGKLHAVAPGTATITANLAANGIYKAKTTTFNVTVIPAQVKYAITFDGNGANGGEAPEAIANKAARVEVTLPANNWTKEGHTFNGWKVINNTTSEEVEVVAGAFEMPASAVTIQAQWAEIPVWATRYSSNITIGTDIVKFSDEPEAPEYAAKKTGTSSTSGSTTVTVPVSTSKLHFHAVCYGGDTYAVTLKVRKGDNVLGTFNIKKDDGAKGSSPFTLKNTPYEQYYSVTLADITEPTTITFEAESGSKNGNRFVLFGVNQEGGLVPELDRIEISGTATKLEYEVGDVFNPAGLGANAIYTLGGVEQEPVAINAKDIEWSFEPATIAANTTSVTVTATYEGMSATKEVSGLSVTVPEPEIIVSAASLAFSNVAKGAAVADKELTVTLKSVENATLTITGDGASAFSVTPAALTASETVAVSASSDNVGTFNATLTISDDAGAAEAQTVALSITVEPSDDLTGTWNLVTDAAELMPGMKVIVASVADGEGNLYTLGGPNGNSANNRIAVASTASGDVLNPEAGTKVITLVDAGNGKYALQLVNGKYLSAAGSGTNNYLKEADAYNSNKEKWTITIAGNKAKIQAASTNRNTIRYNSGNSIFSCYAENGQSAIALYAKPFDYTREIAQGVLSTTCLPNGGKIFGASIFEIAYMDYEANGTTPHKIYFDEVEGGIMEAGMPYVVLANEGAAKFGVYYTDNEDKDAQSKDGLVGYMGEGRALIENEYFIYNNMFYYVSAADAASERIHISKNRAFINLSQVPGYNNEQVSVPAPGRRRVSLGNGANAPTVATGFEAAEANEAPRKVLINGELFILRGEKMYDAKGQLVK